MLYEYREQRACLCNWLFLPKHKLELMFSSIEPCAPCGRTFPATFFPLFVPQTRTGIPAISYQPMKRQLARVLRLPANQLRAIFPCLCSRSQSILTCNSVKLRESSLYFSLIPSFPELITIYVLVNNHDRLHETYLGGPSTLTPTKQPFNHRQPRASKHNNNNLSGPVAVRLLPVPNVKKPPQHVSALPK